MRAMYPSQLGQLRVADPVKLLVKPIGLADDGMCHLLLPLVEISQDQRFIEIIGDADKSIIKGCHTHRRWLCWPVLVRKLMNISHITHRIYRPVYVHAAPSLCE